MALKFCVRVILTAIVLASLLGAVVPVTAATYTVNTLVDELDGSCSNGDCSLRDALALAPAGSTVQFSVTGTIVLGSPISLEKSMTISGPGAARLTLSGNNANRVFVFSGSTNNITLSGLTLANGNSYALYGGAIYNSASLTVNQCVFSNNHSDAVGGAIFAVTNPLVVNDSTFQNNSAGHGGAVALIDASATLTATTFSSNSSTNDGGAIYWETTGLNNTPLTINGSAFFANAAVHSGGALWLFSNNSSVTVNDSVFVGNTANNSTTGNQGLGGAILSVAEMTINRSVFSGNTAGSASTSNNQGGAIYTPNSLNITNSTFYNNKARAGGGALYYANSNGLILNSTIYGNSLFGDGAGPGLAATFNQTEVKNSVIAGNTLANGTPANCSTPGLAASSGFNLSDTADCSPGFSSTTLAALALTWKGRYFYPAGSRAVLEAGNNTVCPATDQRGWRRPVDADGNATATCDIGAIEVSRYFYEQYLPLTLR